MPQLGAQPRLRGTVAFGFTGRKAALRNSEYVEECDRGGTQLTCRVSPVSTCEAFRPCLLKVGARPSTDVRAGQLKKLVTAVASSGEADVGRFW